ncbi:MAG: hypothetical protein KKC76_18265 [Proteobacteria bacterium]|nr:hypothetical protein [Pseudomonadota bacterium]MBU4296649.1 hypothetical protein [Pseudomonadota bacterium]MCG2748442.1 hypothetical protein [Desulfobulbaceae bacterium]
MKLKIGLDFDNTLICYDALFHELALAGNLLPAPQPAKSKDSVREYVRALVDGENTWQQLQARVYGDEIDKANLCTGVPEFLLLCKQAKTPVVIISHKTQFAGKKRDQGGSDADLHRAAKRWMKRHHFFGEQGLGVAEKHVFFEATRQEKAARIREQGCTHFIDDLPEIFAESAFPDGVIKILYSAAESQTVAGIDHHFRSWTDIYRFFSALIGVCRHDCGEAACR